MSSTDEQPREGLLLRRLILALRERERRMNAVSRALHDDVSQPLGALALHLDMLMDRLSACGEDVAGQAAQMPPILDALMARVRELTLDLDPDTVERGGLRFALQRLADETRRSWPGRVELRYEIGRRPERPLASALFRVAAEAVANAVKHSGAKAITIAAVEQDGDGVLTISDDGRGFDPARPEHRLGLGLSGMSVDAELGGFNLTVESTPGKGTMCCSKFPLPV